MSSKQKKSIKELEVLADGLAWMALNSGRRPFGNVGEFTIGRDFGDLQSEDLANRRPGVNPNLNLNGKPRRGRYSKTIGKK